MLCVLVVCTFMQAATCVTLLAILVPVLRHSLLPQSWQEGMELNCKDLDVFQWPQQGQSGKESRGGAPGTHTLLWGNNGRVSYRGKHSPAWSLQHVWQHQKAEGKRGIPMKPSILEEIFLSKTITTTETTSNLFAHIQAQGKLQYANEC